MQTPAKGSPVLRRTRRISPTFADSGLALENRFVRAPVGSRSWIWSFWRERMGSLNLATGVGGGG